MFASVLAEARHLLVRRVAQKRQSKRALDLPTEFGNLLPELFGEKLVRRGMLEQFPTIIASSATTLALVLPFAITGDVAGLEIAHPLALSVLGGVVTMTLGILLVLPALYLRFGAGWTADRLDLEMETAS